MEFLINKILKQGGVKDRFEIKLWLLAIRHG
ncbi:MAG: chemotaxis receptor (MCP) glutamine deamidase CheD [Lentisphaeria bacterium]|jgi:chemotaxis receptor (MCP) glutamine deamidase CheD